MISMLSLDISGAYDNIPYKRFVEMQVIRLKLYILLIFYIGS